VRGPCDCELATLLGWVDLGGAALVGVKPYGLDVHPPGWQWAFKEIVGHGQVYRPVVHVHIHEVNDERHSIGGLEVVTEFRVCPSTVRVDEGTLVTGGEVALRVRGAGTNVDVRQG
jgi:hypothetical protein